MAQKRSSSITYYDPYNVWSLVEEDFTAHLPLRNLHWKSANRPLRSIQSLHVEMRPYQPSAEEQAHQLPVSLLEKPYLNVMLVKCDDNETYRNQARKTIREWYNGVVSKRNQEWMILHVVPKSSNIAGRPSSRFNMKGSVYDKIRADFNSSKKDRCAQLRSCDSEGEELEMWQDILGKIKEGVLQSFDSRVLHYEEDIRKMDSQRTLPGWNYCTFFILKEGLAQSFEHMLLLEDALIQYDELEASFFQMLKDKQLTWFTRTGGTSPGDDSANVLDLSHKDYRILILANNISLFDFRVYLFARQTFFLRAMGKYADICARARDYISTLARTLRNDREDTGISFIESWMFSASMQIIETVSAAPKTKALSAVIGDLYVIARTQLDKIGHNFQLIPGSVPFEGVFTEIPLDATDNPAADNFKTTNPILEEAIKDKEKFCELYEKITSEALKEFENSNRLGSAESMTADLASFYFHKKQYEKAASLLKTLSAASTDKRWNPIDCALMKMYGQCLRLTGDLKGHIDILLKLLLHRNEIGPVDVKEHLKELEEAITQCQTVTECLLSNYFSLQIRSRPTHRENEDGFTLRLVLTNSFPWVIHLTAIKVKVTSLKMAQEIEFKADNVILQQGRNEIQTTCNFTAPGVYIFERAEVMWHSLVFRQEFVEAGKKQYLTLYPHGNALRVSAELGREINVDKATSIVVNVGTGWNTIIRGQVRLRTGVENARFHLDDALCEISSRRNGEKREFGIQPTKSGEMRIEDVARESDIRFTVPFTVHSIEQNELDLKIEVRYVTSTGEYTYFHSGVVSVEIPLSIGVSDIFRPNLLISIFRVRCVEAVRILDVRLDSDKAFNVWTRSPQERNLFCVPDTSLKFIYQITKVGSPEEIAECISRGHPLKLVMTYRRIEKELAYILRGGLDKIIKEYGVERLAFRFYDGIPEMVKRVDLENYRTFNSIMLEGVQWTSAFSDLSQDDQTVAGNVATRFSAMFRDYELTDETFDAVPLETVYIPADIPSVDVVHRVSLHVVDEKEKFHVGRSIRAELSIYSSSNWNLTGSPLNKIECYYDIILDPDVWLLSGGKRAYFTVKDNEKQTFVVTLLPLKIGLLKTPNVQIVTLTPNVLSEVEEASTPDIVVLPTKFMAVYKVDVPEIPGQ